MTNEVRDDEGVAERLDALERFGFDRTTMENYLSEHEAGAHERLSWLEDCRSTAVVLEDRIARLRQTTGRALPQFESVDVFDFLTLDDAYASVDAIMRSIAPWEPFMHRHQASWFNENRGSDWQMMYARLAGLDVSSHASLSPLMNLVSQPDRMDELSRHLELIMDDERRQRTMIKDGYRDLRQHGYAIEEDEDVSLIDALGELEQWHAFHHRREHVRLSIAQLLHPFDAELADDMRQRCSALSHRLQREALDALANEVAQLAGQLEQRREELSATIDEWRRQGIVFPHEGGLLPGDLMEWEANHDSIATKVKVHLDLVERWRRFERLWPSRAERSKPLVGHLDQSSALQDAVDEMDQWWKKAELDALDVLETFEQQGIAVGVWRHRVFEDPMNALEAMVQHRPRWERAVALLRALESLDPVYADTDDVRVRLVVLAEEEPTEALLEEMEAFLLTKQRRQQRHRVMLEDELASIRRQGALPEEVNTDRLGLREFEAHIAQLQRSPSQDSNNESGVSSRMLAGLRVELDDWQRAGWLVDSWLRRLNTNPMDVALGMSVARPHLAQHAALRRRLSALPWERDVQLGLELEQAIRMPEELDRLHRSIPQWSARLAGRSVEREGFKPSLWQPQPPRPTLLPLHEQPAVRVEVVGTSAMDDAHEAMLEAMEEFEHSDEGPLVEQERVVTASKSAKRPMVGEIITKVRSAHSSTVATADVAIETSHPKNDETNQSVTTPLVSTELTVASASSASPSPKSAVDEEMVLTVSHEANPVEESESANRQRDDGGQKAPLVENIEEDVEFIMKAPSNESTASALGVLAELLALLGLSEEVALVQQDGLAALGDVRRALAQHVNQHPRDIRIARLLRLTLRLLPQGDAEDLRRSELLHDLSILIPPIKRWMRRRLEARHGGSSGRLLDDALALGRALERIPGLGYHVPLERDEWPLPSEVSALAAEVQTLRTAIMLPSSGGVQT